MSDIQPFLDKFKAWSENQDNITAVVLLGSYARGTAKEDSDVDLMIIARDPTIYLRDVSWISRFGEVETVKHEDWGMVTAKRVFYKNGLEVEFNFSTPEWAKIDPVDNGTRRVINEGYKILVDKNGILKSLVEHLK